MSGIISSMPVVTLRCTTVLPSLMMELDVRRKSTIKAVSSAMATNQKIFIVMQKRPEIEKPKQEDIYMYGTVAKVRQLERVANTGFRAIVEGMYRGTVVEIEKYEPYMHAQIEVRKDAFSPILDKISEKAMCENLADLIEKYFIENEKKDQVVFSKLRRIKKLKDLISYVYGNIPFHEDEKQMFIEAEDYEEEYAMIITSLSEHIEISKIKREFQQKVKESVEENQKEYILREQMKVIKKELGEDNVLDDADDYYERLEELDADADVIETIEKEIERFKIMPQSSADSNVSRTYIETLLDMPWDKMSKDSKNLNSAVKILEAEHYGLKKVKERIIEFLAVRKLTSKGDAPIICLVGPPGTGKTSIARSVAKALNKKYVRISLGGVRDESEIRGHRRTYVAAMPGKIANALKTAKVKNPLILLDEIDKTSSDYKGDVSSALLEVLDSEQNNKFLDRYLDIPIDLSEVLFIATANDYSGIPKPLLDRMEIIEINSYTQNEKYHIAKDYLVKKQIEKNGLTKKQITFTTKALNEIIMGYTKEAGVRSLERKIASVCRKAAKEIVLDGAEHVKVTEKNLEKYLGKKLYDINMKNEKDDVGIVRGLAWTSVGGVTLSIEVNVFPGKNTFQLTGQLGDVMKESAMTAFSYVKSIAGRFGVEDDYFEKKDFHIHIPEGATPKDGPSAGITMSTAILSAVTGLKVKHNLAMTGEVTLRGKVLPIGGLKEKLLAAKQAKITEVIVPLKNKRDVSEIDEEILDGINITYVETMEEVLTNALVK